MVLSKVLEKTTNFLKKNVIILLLALLVITFNFFLIQKDYIAVENSSNPTNNIENIKNAQSKKKILKFTSSKVYSIVLKLGTSAVNEGSKYTTLRLFSGKKEIFKERINNNIALPQNGPNGIGTSFVLNGKRGLKVEKNKKYTLELTTNAQKGIPVYLDNNGSIWTNSTYNWINKNKLKVVLITAELLLVVGVYSLLKLKKHFFSRTENQFLLVASILVLLYTFIIPALRVPDEMGHFIRAYGILHGYFLMPVSGDIIAHKNLIPISNTVNSTIYETIKHFNISLGSGYTSYNAINMALYSPQSYVLQLLGVGTASIFSNNPFVLIYVGRLITGMGCTIILYYAIKHIPIGKHILAVCSLIPMNIAERSSLSADGFTYAIVIATFAFAIYMKYSSRKMTRKMLFLMYVLLFFLASCKVIYFILGLIVLAIPNKKFGNTYKGIVYKFLSVVLVLGTSFSWLKIAARYLINTQGGGDSNQKILFIVQHPFKYLELINQTIWGNVQSYAEQLLTGPLGSLNIKISFGLTILTVFVLFKTYYHEKLNTKITESPSGIQFYTLCLCIANILLIYTSLFVQWTTISGKIENVTNIMGIQGRYFLPVLPIFMIMFLYPKGNEKLVTGKSKTVFYIFVVNILVLSNAFVSYSF